MNGISTAQDNPRVFIPPPFIFLAGIGAGYALEQILPLRISVPVWLEIAAAVLGLAGLALVGIGLGAFLAHRTHVVPVRPASALIVTGPYRFTRNPMYLGFAAAYLAAAVVLGSGWYLLLFVPVLAIMQRYVIRREEAYLERRFGEQYRAYRRRVRRWL